MCYCLLQLFIYQIVYWCIVLPSLFPLNRFLHYHRIVQWCDLLISLFKMGVQQLCDVLIIGILMNVWIVKLCLICFLVMYYQIIKTYYMLIKNGHVWHMIGWYFNCWTNKHDRLYTILSALPWFYNNIGYSDEIER